MFMPWCCHHGRAIARVHPVHLMNVERRHKHCLGIIIIIIIIIIIHTSHDDTMVQCAMHSVARQKRICLTLNTMNVNSLYHSFCQCTYDSTDALYDAIQCVSKKPDRYS